MKALTIWQPWASLIMAEAKPYEFRSWLPPRSLVGQRMAIHAGARPIKRHEVEELIRALEDGQPWHAALKPELAFPVLRLALDDPEALPLSAIIGTIQLGEPRNGNDIAREFGGAVNDSDRDEHANWGWRMFDVQPLVPPIEMRGMQGLWNWSGAL